LRNDVRKGVSVPGYQPISVTAAEVLTDIETLADFSRKGWIKTVEKNGVVYLAADQRYRAKFILHLRAKKHLSDDQIDLILSVQSPPYSAARVDEILREQAPAPGRTKAERQRGSAPSGQKQRGTEELALG
jgi:hypothetical protein